MPAGFDAATKKTVQGERSVDGILQAVGAGFTSGLVISVFMNPYDRALYLALKERRPFLRKENFRKPYKGAFQTLFQRAFSSGIYFPLEDLSRQAIVEGAPSVRGPAVDALAGQSAGIATGLLLHPLAFVKYQTWGNDERSLWRTTAKLLRSSPGAFIFLRGLPSTLLRDMIFGGVFATGRRWFTVSDPALKFLSNAAAASAATVLSSPFNYVRAMQFAEGGKNPTPPSIRQLLARLSGEVRDLGSAGDLRPQLLHLQSRLQIGWGTLRVTLGMSLSAAMYDALSNLD